MKKAAELSIVVKAQIEKATTQIRKLRASFTKAGQGARELNANAQKTASALKKTQSAASGLKDTLMGLAQAYVGMRWIRSWVRDANEFKMAMIGLSSIAKFKGIEVAKAFKAASEIAADGLIDVGSAAKALQNLLVRGYGIDQAVQMLQRLKDAAAVNRQGHLSMAEAIVSATEGLKNENSILVDNAGVTKNVSVMWKEYAAQIGKTVGQLTLAEKRQAEYLGIMQETEPMVGNAAKLANEFQGQQAKLNQELKIFNAMMGEMIIPVLAKMTEIANNFLRNVMRPLIWRIKASGVIWANWAESIKIIGHWIRTGFRGGISKLKKDLKELDEIGQEMLEDLAMQMEKNPFELAAENAKKMTEQEKEAIRITEQLKQYQAELTLLQSDRKKALQDEARALQETNRTVKAGLRDAIRLQKKYADEVKKQEQEIANVAQDTQDKINAIRMRGLTDEQKQYVLIEQYQEKLAKAAEEYYGGSLEQASKLAKQAQDIAANLSDQEEAMRGVEDAGNLLVRIHEEMKEKAQESLDTQNEKVADLQTQLDKCEKKFENIKKQLDDIAKKKTLAQVDADISQAKAKIDELKRTLQELKRQEIVIEIKGKASPVKPISQTLADVSQKINQITRNKELTLKFSIPNLSLPQTQVGSMTKSYHLHIGGITKGVPLHMRNLLEKLSREMELMEAR